MGAGQGVGIIGRGEEEGGGAEEKERDKGEEDECEDEKRIRSAGGGGESGAEGGEMGRLSCYSEGKENEAAAVRLLTASGPRSWWMWRLNGIKGPFVLQGPRFAGGAQVEV